MATAQQTKVLKSTGTLIDPATSGDISALKSAVTGSTLTVSATSSTWEVGIYTAVNSTQTFTGNVAVTTMPSNTWDANLATHDDLTALRTALTTSTTVTGQVRSVITGATGNSAGVGLLSTDSIGQNNLGLDVRSYGFALNPTTGYFNRLESSPTDTGALIVETGSERTQGKTQVFKVGSVTTTNASENVVTNATYTVTAGKTLFVRSWDCMATLSTLISSTTYTSFGTASLESPTSTKIKTSRYVGVNSVSGYQNVFNPPIPIAAGVNIRITVTPTVGSSKIWDCNFDGFEK